MHSPYVELGIISIQANEVSEKRLTKPITYFRSNQKMFCLDVILIRKGPRIVAAGQLEGPSVSHGKFQYDVGSRGQPIKGVRLRHEFLGGSRTCIGKEWNKG